MDPKRVNEFGTSGEDTSAEVTQTDLPGSDSNGEPPEPDNSSVSMNTREETLQNQELSSHPGTEKSFEEKKND